MSSSKESQSLTQHLLSLNPEAFKKATQSPFLEKAGKGTLSKSTLQKWLSQDRLYAQAYIRFASLLLANTPLPSSISPTHINERITDLLIDSLTNVRRELKFFESVAQTYGLDINSKEGEESEGVKGYRKLFFETGEGIERRVVPFVHGLVLLWATEICYLEAWRYAASFLRGEGGGDADGGALRKEFIPNWTSDEFVEFVEKIGGLVDELWEGGSGFLPMERGNGEGKGRRGEEETRMIEELWEQVVEVEEGFWPAV